MRKRDSEGHRVRKVKERKKDEIHRERERERAEKTRK